MAASSAVTAPGKPRTSHLALKVFGSAAILSVAVAFVFNYVFDLYLHYNETAFNETGPNHWALRGWLLVHMTAGTVTLLTGPMQFWTGFRRRYARLHRWTGRLFLGGVAVGSVCAYRLAIGTGLGWGWGFALLVMTTAWATSAAMAYYAIVKRRVQIHQEWMVRTYVVTFAFVTIRVLADYYPGSRLPENDRAVTYAWASWVLPLLFTELILQLRRMRSSP
jgi:uncharacterized membrane protein YozB (DUF420 family)